MLIHVQSLWSDEYLEVQSATVPGGATVPGSDLQPGIVYYPNSLNVKYLLTEPIAVEAPPSFASGELAAVWSINQLEIFNPQATPQKILNVIFKPPTDSGQAFPPDLLGLASAGLLMSDWDEKFRASALDDLNAIGEFAQPYWKDQTPSKDLLARAALGKQDFDLKLQWSAGEYARRGIFSLGSSTTPKAAFSGGLITLTINTRDIASKAISGCTVWYVARINHMKPASYRSFSNYSTPTSESLAVGNYEIWAEKSGATGPHRTISISSVSTTQSADVTAP